MRGNIDLQGFALGIECENFFVCGLLVPHRGFEVEPQELNDKQMESQEAKPVRWGNHGLPRFFKTGGVPAEDAPSGFSL